MIVRAKGSPSDLERICQLYRQPVHRFFSLILRSDEKADDVTQEFFARRILADNSLLERANKNRGSFRGYLMTALRHFAIDHVMRKSPGPVDNANGINDPPDAATLREPIREFERQWAATAFALALEHVKTDCEARGMHRQWTVFEQRVVRKAMLGCDAAPFDDVADLVGSLHRHELDTMLLTMNRKFKRALRDVVADTIDADDPTSIGAEVDALCRALG